jgi:hypothetical protein
MSQNPGVGAGISAGAVVSTKTPLTASTPVTASVTSTSSTVVSANASRKGLIIVNLSTTPVYFGIGANNAQLNYGIALTGLGSVWNMSEYDYNTSAINAITATTATISIQEFI